MHNEEPVFYHSPPDEKTGLLNQKQASPKSLGAHPMDNQRQRDLLFEVSEDLLCVAGFDGYFIQVNPAWTLRLGWSEEELLSKPIIEFVHPDDREMTLKNRTVIHQGKPLKHFENRYLCKNGSCCWLSWSSHPFEETEQVFCIARDITQTKKIENQLLYSHRMESVGTLAGGIAHHLNNTLTPLNMTLDFLLMQKLDNDTQGLIENSQQSLHKGIKLIQRLLEYAQPKPIQPETISVPSLIHAVLDLLEETIPSSVNINRNLEANLPPLNGDFAKLQQVFVELIINAVDAMPEGGTLSISAYQCVLRDSDLMEMPNASAGPYVAIEVQDEGPGIPAEDLSRIFEPFYTKKDTGKGTGLGLSTAYTVIRNHQGCIRVESPPGAGCCMQVFLPL